MICNKTRNRTGTILGWPIPALDPKHPSSPMLRDPGNRYRDILRKDPYPFRHKVDTPWQNLPDLEEINRTAYNRIGHALELVQKQSESQGIVVLGEAGSGKTHLLMRVAQKLGGGNYVLFVPKPNNEDAVYLHTWSNIVQSLAEIVPGRSRDRSQLDDLLAHVFSNVLVPEFQSGNEQEQRWARKLLDNPLSLFGMLGTGQPREENFRKIRSRTLKFLKLKHPKINETITHALVTYALAAQDETRRKILTWLAGQGGLDETEAKQLGLPIHWVEVTEQSSNTSYLQQREDQAFEAIKTLGMLSTYYQPLILAYDQLEGLRSRKTLTQRWSAAVREIINFAPNYLVITCVFPDLWQKWCGEIWIETSAVDRIAPRTVMLEPFATPAARRLLEGQTATKARELNFPSPIYPFTDGDIAEMCSKAKTPRQFLLDALNRFENWLFEDDGTIDQPIQPPLDSIEDVLNKELGRLFKKAQTFVKKQVPHEEDLFGRVKTIIEVLLQNPAPHIVEATLGTLVMPFNIVVLPPGSAGLCLSVLNAAGNPLTARLRNLQEGAQRGMGFESVTVLRDRRCGQPGGAVGKTMLEKLEAQGGKYLLADLDELARIHAIYDAITAIEQEDITANGRPITEAELVEFLRASDHLKKISLFVEAAKLAPLFHDLIHGSR